MLRKQTKHIVFCLLWVLAVHLTQRPSDVKAGTFTVTPRYVGSFDTQNNSLGMLDLSQPQDATVVHQFDFSVELAGMAADESFGAVAFNIDLGSGISQARGGWQADDSTYDVSNPFGSTTKPLWSNNGDLGESPSDFQAILSMMNATSAKATDFGRSEDGPTRLGSIFVLWDGSSDGRIDISPISGSSMAIFTEDNDGMSTFKAIADGFRSGGFQFGENAGQTAPVDYVPPVRRPMSIVEEPITPEPAIPEVVNPVVVLPPVVDPIIIVPEVVDPVVDPIVIPPVVMDPIEVLPEVTSPVPPAPTVVDPIFEPPFAGDPFPIRPIDAHWADGEEDVQYEVLFPMINVIEYPRIVYRWVDENGRTREGFRYPGMDDERDDMPLIITFADSARLAATATPFAASGPALPEPSAIALTWSGIFLLLSGQRRRRKRSFAGAVSV